MTNEKIKRYVRKVGLSISFFLLSLFYCFQSPLNPWEGSDVTADSGVFQYVAHIMHKGQMPYRDTFDHKGPLLYIINWLGQFISPYRGIWVIEVFFLTVTFWLMYKIARLLAGRAFSCATVVICSSLLLSYFQKGNFVEEYALPFIAAALFIFLDYFLNNKVTTPRLILCGLSFGCVFWLRPNMVALWVVFCIAVLVKEVRRHDWFNLIKFLLLFVLGISIITIPIIVWLAKNNAIKDFWFDYFIFNGLYSSADAGGATWSARIRSLTIFTSNNLFLVSACTLGFWFLFRRKAIHWIYAACVLCNLFFITISGQAYGHYGLILIPLYVYPIATFEGIVNEINDNQKLGKWVTYLCTCFILIIWILPEMILSIYTISIKYDNREEGQLLEKTQCVVRLIKEKTSASDCITVYGNWDLIYILSNRLSASKYSYQFPIAEVLPAIKEEYFADLEQTMPRIVVIETGRSDQDIYDFLDSNSYELLWQDETDGTMVYNRK